MRQHFSHYSARQVPHVSGPYSLHLKAFRYLTENRFYSIAIATQPSTDCSIPIPARQLKRHYHLNSLFAQLLAQVRLPVITISQAIAFCLSRQLLKRRRITQASRGYYNSRYYSGPTHSHVKSEAIKGLLYRMIFAEISFASKALRARSAPEAANSHREAINNSKACVTVSLSDQLLPKGFFEFPKIRCLSNKSGAMDKSQSREEIREMTAEVVEYGFVLVESKELSDDLNSEDFAVGKSRLRPALAQAAMAEVIRNSVINEAKHSYNEIIQVQGKRPPIVGLAITIENSSPWTFNFDLKTCTSR
jgi:hypothetical protein